MKENKTISVFGNHDLPDPESDIITRAGDDFSHYTHLFIRNGWKFKMEDDYVVLEKMTAHGKIYNMYCDSQDFPHDFSSQVVRFNTSMAASIFKRNYPQLTNNQTMADMILIRQDLIKLRNLVSRQQKAVQNIALDKEIYEQIEKMNFELNEDDEFVYLIDVRGENNSNIPFVNNVFLNILNSQLQISVPCLDTFKEMEEKWNDFLETIYKGKKQEVKNELLHNTLQAITRKSYGELVDEDEKTDYILARENRLFEFKYNYDPFYELPLYYNPVTERFVAGKSTEAGATLAEIIDGLSIGMAEFKNMFSSFRETDWSVEGKEMVTDEDLIVFDCNIPYEEEKDGDGLKACVVFEKVGSGKKHTLDYRVYRDENDKLTIDFYDVDEGRSPFSIEEFKEGHRDELEDLEYDLLNYYHDNFEISKENSSYYG